MQNTLSSLLSKYIGYFILGLAFIFIFHSFSRQNTLSFAISHEELVPVERISIVIQYTSRQVTREGLAGVGDSELTNFYQRLQSLSGITYQESAPQISLLGTNYQYQKTIRLDVTDVTKYPEVKLVLDGLPVQIVQTIFTPVEDQESAYSNLRKKADAQANMLAKTANKRAGGVISVTEAPTQLREGSSNFTTVSQDGVLLMPLNKTATFEYAIW